MGAKEKILELMDEENKRHIDDYVYFLAHMNRPEDISELQFNSSKRWGAGYNQMYGPLMIELYKKSETVRHEINAQVRKFGLSAEAISGYFTETITHGNIPWLLGALVAEDKKDEFITLTGQLMLSHLKKYAGL
jgi:hypothetical protein